MASASFPLSVDNLALVLTERSKRDAMAAYAGDVQWSILCSLHSLGGSMCKIDSYSTVFEKINGDKKQDDPRESNTETLRRVEDMISQFLPRKEE